ncbi:hypothetical protein OIO90_001836 [Microbotryomycetes sp. JL221]|nr:hypothetical protein OIO90_001836 [Microbotryomycetes sp. JL221]
MVQLKPIPMRRKTLLGDHPICSSVTMEDRFVFIQHFQLRPARCLHASLHYFSYEAGDVIGTGSFGVIRKVKRKADGLILARKELNYGRMDERDLKQLTEEV